MAGEQGIYTLELAPDGLERGIYTLERQARTLEKSIVMLKRSADAVGDEDNDE